MSKFLDSFAKYFYENFLSNSRKTCIVFPGRRSGLYFKHYLSAYTDKPMWSPAIFTINELVEKMSGKEANDNISLVLELYKVFRDKTGTAESFDDFLFWGEMLLGDFDDLDKYLVDAKQLFTNLANIKEIDIKFGLTDGIDTEALESFWSSLGKGESQHQKNFLELWTNLHDIYLAFKDVLSAKNMAYQGMLLREVAEDKMLIEKSESAFEKYLFVGFNALSKAEKEIFKNLQKKGKAEFFWDFDDYYIQDLHHEAGRFIRENMNLFPSPANWFMDSNHYKNLKNITVCNVPSNVGQAKVMPQFVKEGEDYNRPDSLAVVLADENLLLPTLFSLPGKESAVNITMGYPLKNTPVYGLIENLVDLYANVIEEKGQKKFRYIEVLKILRNQYIQILDKKSCLKGIDEIQNQSIFKISPDFFDYSEELKDLFQTFTSVYELGNVFRNILFKIHTAFQSINDKEYFLEQEHVFYVYKIVTRVQQVLESEVNIGLKAYLNILRKHIKASSIPFKGEPLSGIQLMGLLETRTLDFDEIIILSVNEGSLPKKSTAPSYVPYNLRKAFGMPTPDYQDAIFSYYFYRLIQRAQRLVLVFNSDRSGADTGESSRFIFQMKYEQNKPLKEILFGSNVYGQTKRNITIEKDDRVMQVLEQYSKEDGRYLSPSALNTYIDCSLKFYLKYIAELEKKEDIADEIDPAQFGSILHETMYFLYDNQKIITSEELDAIIANEELVKKAIEESFSKVIYNKKKLVYDNLSGRNKLIFKVILKYTKQILKQDRKSTPFTIIALEKGYYMSLEVSCNNRMQKFQIGGKVDRIDKIGKTYRIIDYKTGKVALSFKTVDELFDRNKKSRNKNLMQVLLYSVIFNNTHYENCNVQPGIYSLKDIYDEAFSTDVKCNNQRIEDISDYKNDVLFHVKEVLAEIFSSEIPFKQTENEDVCEYCDYAGICSK